MGIADLIVMDRHLYLGISFWNRTTVNAELGAIAGTVAQAHLGGLSKIAHIKSIAVMVLRLTRSPLRRMDAR
jgi:hypothetical protein